MEEDIQGEEDDEERSEGRSKEKGRKKSLLLKRGVKIPQMMLTQLTRVFVKMEESTSCLM